MATIIERVKQSIASNTDIADGATMVVAYSGGADSSALLHMLHRLGYRITALHCNFHLRGDESNRDEQHARATARAMGIPIRVRHFDVEQYRRDNKVSVEMACRELRYQWFEQQRRELRAVAIAVAHHLDDNIETFFLNLLRGTSIEGLTGMLPYDSRNYLLRPLLDISRAELERYIAENGITYVVDSTNAQSDFRRNRLRNIVIPALKSAFPDCDERIAQTMAILTQNSSYYHRACTADIERCTNADGSICLSRVAALPQADLALYEHLKSDGINMSQVRDMFSARDASGRRFDASSATYFVDRGNLYRLDNAQSATAQNGVEIYLAGIDALNPQLAPNYAFFNREVADRIADIEVRPWQPADRMKPWGMKGSKKLSDIFNDAKIATFDKAGYPVVTLDGEILWLAGLRASRLYPITNTDTVITVMRLKR